VQYPNVQAAAKKELDDEMEKQKADREKYTEDQVYFDQQKAECKVSRRSLFQHIQNAS